MQLIASGRSANVYALDEHRVLRRDTRGYDVTPHAELLQHLAGHGLAVPAVLDVDGADLIMERLRGPDLGAAMLGGDVTVVRGFQLMGELHNALAAVPVPAGMRLADEASAGEPTIAHLDFHPLNVMFDGDRVVLIDWENARRGSRALDLALSTVILRTAAVEGSFAESGFDVEAGLRVLMEATGVDPVPELERAIDRRLTDPNLTARERELVEGQRAR